MFDLATFGLTDMLVCSSDLRRLGASADSMEGAAGEIVRYLYGQLIEKESNRPALALVRLYKTHRYDELEPDLQEFATSRSAGGHIDPAAPCLTLLATAGEEPAWNDRRRSTNHKAIPLRDEAAVAELPMVSALTRQLGFAEADVVRPDRRLFPVVGNRPAGVFYVPDALGSEQVPAQDTFVKPYGIRSVLGFGGMLPSGYVFAVVMFAKIAIPDHVAHLFGSLSLAAELSLLPFVERRLFESDAPDTRDDVERDLRQARAEVFALGHLLDVRQRIVTEQAVRLEQALREAEERAEALARAQARAETSEAVKTAILDAALDCIITMDEAGTIVDFNPAAERTFGYRSVDVAGRALADVVIPDRLREPHRAGLERYLRTGEGPILGRRIEVQAVRADGSEFPVELTVAAVHAGGRRLFSGHVRDITERKRAEEELRAAGERYAHIALTLQASFLPPALPDIPKVEVATIYRPGLGMEVGGDFYDVFDLGSDRWGVVLGDVMGRGPEAAATTALARHTVRAAAIATSAPQSVLRLLNDALHRDDPYRFCTAAFGHLEVGGAVRLSLASAGHPHALLRHQGTGKTDEILTSGTILGPFENWVGEKVATLDLDQGDLVLLFSDGVVEARRGREIFGGDRLRTVLEATRDAGAAETVGAVMEAVDDFATDRGDDVAILALRVRDDGS